MNIKNSSLNCVMKIIERYKHRNSLLNPYLDDLGKLIMPKIINLSSGKSIVFDEKNIENVCELAEFLNKNNKSTSVDEWYSWVFDAVARALGEIDFNDCPNDIDKKILNKIEKFVNSKKEMEFNIEIPFPCELFFSDFDPLLSFGPVRYELCHDWLRRKHDEGFITCSTKEKIFCLLEEKENNSRINNSVNRNQEEVIINLIRSAPFICSITTRGMAPEFARSRAKTTARLALTSIALLWENTSTVLGAMNLVDDRVVRILHEITFQANGASSYGSRKSHFPGGQVISEKDWIFHIDKHHGYFKVIGEILNSIVNIYYSVKRPKINQALLHALLWFEKGCREDESVVSVINFTVALDCLVGGKGREGIINLIRSRLNLDNTDHIFHFREKTLEEEVNEIYDLARNATLHGRINHKSRKPDSQPFYDWGAARSRAEKLARYCLLSCIDQASIFPEIDDPSSWSKY